MKPAWLIVGLTSVLWALLLRNPMCHANFLRQAGSSDWTYRENAAAPGSGVCVSQVPLYEQNEVVSELQTDHPDNPDVRLGFLSNEYSIPDVDNFLSSLTGNTAYARAYYAADLEAEGRSMGMGRFDNPYMDPLWPRPDSAPLHGILATAPPEAWLKFLRKAKYAATLEPDNTFFDWMQMAPLFALHRDGEALALLNASAGKMRYDEHRAEQKLAALRAREINGRLSPFQLVSAPGSDAEFGEVGMQNAGMMTGVTQCAMGHVLELRQNNHPSEALKLAFNLLKLTKLVRRQSYTLAGSENGTEMETTVLLGICPPLPSIGAPGFASPSSPAGTFNLAAYALASGQPKLASWATAESANCLGWFAATDFRDPPPFQGENLATVEAMQERWGRIVLWTLPACAWLLAFSALGAWRPLSKQRVSGISPWLGALAGLAVLGVFAWGDSGLYQRVALTCESFGLDHAEQAPGLCELAPLVVRGTVVVVLLLMALGQRGAGWKALLRDLFTRPQGTREFDPTAIMRFSAKITLWLLPWLVFADFCFSPEIAPEGNQYEFLLHSGLVAAGLWALLLFVALSRRLKLRKTEGFFLPVMTNLRNLAAGYLLAALLLYAVMALLMIPAEAQFRSAYESYLRAGETATIERQLGL